MLIPLADRVELPAGKYFISDLMGCTVFELPEGVERNWHRPLVLRKKRRACWARSAMFSSREKAWPGRRCFRWKLPLAKC